MILARYIARYELRILNLDVLSTKRAAVYTVTALPGSTHLEALTNLIHLLMVTKRDCRMTVDAGAMDMIQRSVSCRVQGLQDGNDKRETQDTILRGEMTESVETESTDLSSAEEDATMTETANDKPMSVKVEKVEWFGDGWCL